MFDLHQLTALLYIIGKHTTLIYNDSFDKKQLILSTLAPDSGEILMFADRAFFAVDSNAIASDSIFLQLFPERKLDRIEVGLIKLKPDTDTEKCDRGQRVVIARALVSHPKIVLADEPTLLHSTKNLGVSDVLEIMQKVAKEQGCTISLVTHDNRILDIADHIYMEHSQLKTDSVDVVTVSN